MSIQTMCKVVALLAGFWAHSCSAQVAYEFWHLLKDKDGATLFSQSDYEEPRGPVTAFSCRKGDAQITIREYQEPMSRGDPSTTVWRPMNGAKKVKGCDSLCRRMIRESLRGTNPEKQQIDLIASDSDSHFRSERTWGPVLSRIIARHLKSRGQFGEKEAPAIARGVRGNLRLFDQFKSRCELSE